MVLARLVESQIWHLPSGSVALWGKVQKRDNGLCPPFSVWEKAVPQHSPWCQILQFFPVCCWCLSSCYPVAGAQREWVWVSLCVDCLRGTAWDLRSFFHQLNLHWCLQPEVMGTYLPSVECLAEGPGVGLTPCSWDIPSEFLSTTRACGTSPFCISTPLTNLDGYSFFNSIVVRLPSTQGNIPDPPTPECSWGFPVSWPGAESPGPWPLSNFPS